MSIDSSFDTPEHFEQASQKSPEALEREIDQQRSSIGNIVDALERKMSPGQLVDQALTYAKDNGGEFFGNLGNNVKTNPVPAVLTTIGIVWLMLGNRTPTDPSSAGPSLFEGVSERAENVVGAVSDSLSSAKARVQETVALMKDRVSEVKDKTTHFTDSMDEKRSQASGLLHETGRTFEQKRLRLQSSATRLLNEQPLTLAVLGIAVGAVMGAALPATDGEKRLVRQAREKLSGVSPAQRTATTPANRSTTDYHGLDRNGSGVAASSAPQPPATLGLG